jgi:NitT/TauT family transport system substrate-binding protein
MKQQLLVLLAAAIASMATHRAVAEPFKIASPQRGSWESAIPELGRRQGFFQKHGLDLEVLFTSGSGETIQVVIAGAVDVGLSAGTVGVFGAHAKGGPVRIIGASETGSTDTFWYVAAGSPIQTIRDAKDATIAYSTTGASTHIGVLRFISEYGLKAKPIATGNPAATITQVMSGQVDVGWAVAPFQLDAVERGQVRIVGRASDIAAIRGQTIRVQVTNARTLAERKSALDRYALAYRETLDWMYASPDALKGYMEFSGFSEPAVRRTIRDFITKDSLQTSQINGIKESMEDAVQFKFMDAPLSDQQLKQLIQILPFPQ